MWFKRWGIPNVYRLEPARKTPQKVAVRVETRRVEATPRKVESPARRDLPARPVPAHLLLSAV